MTINCPRCGVPTLENAPEDAEFDEVLCETCYENWAQVDEPENDELAWNGKILIRHRNVCKYWTEDGCNICTTCLMQEPSEEACDACVHKCKVLIWDGLYCPVGGKV